MECSVNSAVQPRSYRSLAVPSSTSSRHCVSITSGGRDCIGMCVPMQAAVDDIDAVMPGLTASRNVDGILVTMPRKFR